MIVYKIIQYDKINNINDYIPGGLLPVIKYEHTASNSEKARIEDIFENVRKSEFHTCPSRHGDVFFVFYSLDDEFSWLFQMSKNESIDYILVTLDIKKDDIVWFNVDYFDDSANQSDEIVSQNAKRYWQSKTSEPNSNTGILYEGLVIGTNKIVAFKRKHWNHQNREIANIED